MKIFKIIGLFSIALFSFYYTEKISNYILENNTLYKEISRLQNNYLIEAVPAFIEDDFIVPGINGLKVNVKKSFYNMKDFEAFNEYYLVYEEVGVQHKLQDNKDKIIKKGNSNKKAISFVLENDEAILKYFKDNNINADVLVSLDNFRPNSFFEQINNDINNYSKVESLLKNNNLNKDLCLINQNIEKLCRQKNKYLIKSLELINNNFYDIKNNITSGDIILIKKGVSIDYIRVLIDTIKYKDLNIVILSELLSEQR